MSDFFLVLMDLMFFFSRVFLFLFAPSLRSSVTIFGCLVCGAEPISGL